MKSEQIIINDDNGLVVTAAIESNVFTYIEIQYGPMVFHYECEDFNLNESYIHAFKPDIVFNVSGKTADKIFDLGVQYSK